MLYRLYSQLQSAPEGASPCFRANSASEPILKFEEISEGDEADLG
jgi:hypothetical protein